MSQGYERPMSFIRPAAAAAFSDQAKSNKFVRTCRYRPLAAFCRRMDGAGVVQEVSLEV